MNFELTVYGYLFVIRSDEEGRVTSRNTRDVETDIMVFVLVNLAFRSIERDGEFGVAFRING